MNKLYNAFNNRVNQQPQKERKMSKIYNRATIEKCPTELYEEKKDAERERDYVLSALSEIQNIILAAEKENCPNWEKTVYLVKQMAGENLKIFGRGDSKPG